MLEKNEIILAVAAFCSAWLGFQAWKRRWGETALVALLLAPSPLIALTAFEKTTDIGAGFEKLGVFAVASAVSALFIVPYVVGYGFGMLKGR
jgi:hypothetical protein